MYLPQLLEALKFEKSDFSELTAMLFQFSAKSIRFAHKLYWQLMEFSSHNQSCMRLRYHMLLQALKHFFSRAMKLEISRECLLLDQIDTIGLEVKKHKDNPALCSERLQRSLEKLASDWSTQDPCRLPLNISYCVREVDSKVIFNIKL